MSLPIPTAGLKTNDDRLVSSKALWDTGATNSSITSSFARKLNLSPISFTQCHHAQGVSTVPVYLLNIYLPNNVAIEALKVSEIADAEGFEVLIGMDVITLGDFSITNFLGKTCVSFRIPSIEEVDYVERHRTIDAPLESRLKASPAPPSRNSQCPCGSGKQYKRCCGKAA